MLRVIRNEATLLLATLAIVAVTAAAAFSEAPPTIRLTGPGDRASVPWRPCVDGIVSDAKATVFVIVHPLADSTYWVAPRASSRPAGQGAAFRTLAYIGQNSPRDEGVRVEVMAVANPVAPLREGDRLRDWPAAGARSRVIELVRHDSAADGCDRLPSTPVAGDVQGEPSTTGASLAQVNTHTETPVWMPDFAPRTSAREDRGGPHWAWWLLLLLVIVLLAQRDRTHAALDYCAARHRSLERIASRLVARVERAAAWGASRASTSAAIVDAAWYAPGLRVRPGRVLLAFLLTALLAPAAWLAFVVDIRTIESGLTMVFPPVTHAGVAASDLFAEESEPLAERLGDTSQSAPALGLWQPVQEALRRPFGAMAVGLGALQGGFGAILLLGLNRRTVAQLRFAALVAERPLGTVCFLVLDFALAGLAAIRSYESSSDGLVGVFATSAALATAAVMPWLLALIAHVLVCVMVTVAAWTAHAGGLVLALLTSAIAWLSVMLVLALLVVPTAMGFAVTFAAITLTRGTLWLIDGMRDMLVSIWHVLFPGAGHPRPVRPAPLVLPTVLLFFTSMSEAGTTPAVVAPAGPSAWVLCIDTSLSVDAGQFERVKKALRRTIDTAVTFGDRVWVIEMGDKMTAVRLFRVGAGSFRKSERRRTGEAANLAKKQMVDAIAGLSRQARKTNIVDAVELGLAILHDQPTVFTKRLVVASDFITDEGGRPIHLGATSPQPGLTSEDAHVGLMIARPIQRYLDVFRLSPAAHAQAVTREWRRFFDALGARSFAAHMVDALAVN